MHAGGSSIDSFRQHASFFLLVALLKVRSVDLSMLDPVKLDLEAGDRAGQVAPGPVAENLSATYAVIISLPSPAASKTPQKIGPVGFEPTTKGL